MNTKKRVLATQQALQEISVALDKLRKKLSEDSDNSSLFFARCLIYRILLNIDVEAFEKTLERMTVKKGVIIDNPLKTFLADFENLKKARDALDAIIGFHSTTNEEKTKC